MVSTKLLKVGENHTFEEIVNFLMDFGYEKVSNTVINSGDFSLNGDTLKIFPVQSLSPLVVIFFGKIIEKMYFYDLQSGRKKEETPEIEILPNKIEFSDRNFLSTGDYVVHEDHGVGLFKRISVREVEGEDLTYFEIEYLNNSMLYVPSTQLEKLSKYIGVGKRKPKLNKLGGTTWKKNYKKIYEDVLKLAKELLSIYAKRASVEKKPLTINQDWNSEIIKTFRFRETPDQENAIKAVFDDLISKQPMDRLLCGDVGFGKTEVALRAAVQGVSNGYQIVVLVPTTILAEQHFSTFRERLADLPIRVDRLSRFISDEQQKRVIERCESGSTDILIGTHSVLRKTIGFRNLGVLIIDEEQKFGVKDKEKLKKFREQIDVLSLTATPIPRTLFMSLSGLRDISLISSVPAGRKSVTTEVGLFNQESIRNCIERELNRKGQVYYLHNKVATIAPVRAWLQKAFPLAKIEIAHGQMGENALAKVMKDFAEKKVDILVCSTIIENGLDLPNVNTLIADESDKFGLSQLYQIRGRIGRSPEQAYALFTYRDKNLTLNAIRRLKAIVENTDLGTGYNLALEDLEIRGGGNILGREQHGSMETVGLVLYSKLLSKAVKDLRAEGAA